tara:strand:+ start:484 stop:1665 length:1182 start_codon:yes stop_codon:yes gene_type:complete
LTLSFEKFNNYFFSFLLFLLVFSYTYLPLNYFAIEKSYLMIFSCIILLFYLLINNNTLKDLLNNQEMLIWYFIFLLWYSVRLIDATYLQRSQVDFISIYFINTITIFLCINFSKLKFYVTKIIFGLSLFYLIACFASFYFLADNQTSGFVNIFTFFGINFDGSIYQNIGLWLSFLVLISFNYLKDISNNFNQNKSKNFFYLFVFISSFIFLLIIGARGAFVATIISLLFLARNFNFKSFLTISLLFFFTFGIIYSLNPDNLIAGNSTIFRLLGLLNSVDDSARIYLFSNAIDLWTTNFYTLFFGGGVKSFPIYINQNITGWYPHNIFLEVLCELGILGFLFFLKILATGATNIKQDEIGAALSIFMVILFCVTGSIDSSYQILFFLSLYSFNK